MCNKSKKKNVNSHVFTFQQNVKTLKKRKQRFRDTLTDQSLTIQINNDMLRLELAWVTLRELRNLFYLNEKQRANTGL